MDDIDRLLLNTIQSDFPIRERPFDTLGQRLGISGDEALNRVRALVEAGMIRKVGASFDTRRLGHVSALVAAKVRPDRLEEAARIVSEYPEVTHNYGRDFEYNLWFTLVCETLDRLDSVIAEIAFRAGIESIHKLPAQRTFKIKVDFEF